MSQVRGAFPQLMAPGLKHIYMDATEYEQKEKQYPMLFNEESSDSEYEQELEMAGLGPLQEKPENASTAYNNMIQGGSKRAVHLTYSLGVRTSKELWDDDKYGIIKMGPKALARSTRFTEEVIAWNIINQGFSTNITTFDGQALFSNQHYLLGGAGATNIGPGLANVISAAGTYPNRPPTDIDLSVAGLQLATNYANRMVDNQGMPINVKFKYLVIPPELVFIAREILGSSGQPYSSDNTINSILAEDYKFMVGNYLTSGSAWYLFVEKKYHALKVFMREAPNTDFDDDFDTDAVKQKTRMRMSAFCPRWQGTFGSNGP
jgi:phage major head subunit gpT-like protein